LDFQDHLDRWFSGRANSRFHRGIRAVPAERLIEERQEGLAKRVAKLLDLIATGV
jgi:hypothetical protein